MSTILWNFTRVFNIQTILASSAVTSPVKIMCVTFSNVKIVRLPMKSWPVYIWKNEIYISLCEKLILVVWLLVLKLASHSAAESQKRIHGNLCEHCPAVWLQRLMADVEGRFDFLLVHVSYFLIFNLIFFRTAWSEGPLFTAKTHWNFTWRWSRAIGGQI